MQISSLLSCTPNPFKIVDNTFFLFGDDMILQPHISKSLMIYPPSVKYNSWPFCLTYICRWSLCRSKKGVDICVNSPSSVLMVVDFKFSLSHFKYNSVKLLSIHITVSISRLSAFVTLKYARKSIRVCIRSSVSLILGGTGIANLSPRPSLYI